MHFPSLINGSSFKRTRRKKEEEKEKKSPKRDILGKKRSWNGSQFFHLRLWLRVKCKLLLPMKNSTHYLSAIDIGNFTIVVYFCLLTTNFGKFCCLSKLIVWDIGWVVLSIDCVAHAQADESITYQIACLKVHVISDRGFGSRYFWPWIWLCSTHSLLCYDSCFK